ncbi:MAG: molybdopterin molybdotransferase MoeA [Candidatus Rokubacteria bacterium]|nr:molybdopterin molybdotransferase MoeA [Candidatus Rokubacteria bacterium]
MLTVEEARAEILARVRPLETECVDLLGALGRVLAEPVVSTREIPPWSNSAMDGYAVRAEDARARGSRLRVVGRIAAGSLPRRSLAAGEAMRIFTGAPLPEGADAVVPQEEVEVEGNGILIRNTVEIGAFVRPRGEDVRAGETVVERGAVIGPAEVGLLATLGRAQLRVYRRPRVAILSTGDELADLGSEPAPGQIPNSNTYSLMGQVVEAGGEPINLGVARDQLESIEERLRWSLGADVLISSAGVSVGEHDLVKEALTRAGAELHLWQVSMRPGKPITFGSLLGRPVFGLPGNPVSAMVTFELFVRPALRAMAGHRTLDRLRVRARAIEPIPNPGSRRGYLRVMLVSEAGGYGARLTGNQGSSILRSMAQADGLAVVPGDTVVRVGSDVEVIVLRGLEQRSL